MARGFLVWGTYLGVLGAPLAMSPGAYNPFGPIKIVVLSVSAALVMIGALFSINSADRISSRYLRSPVGVALCLYLLALVGGTVLSPLPGVSLLGRYPDAQGLMTYLMYVVVGSALALILREKAERKRFAVLVSVAVAVASLYALLQFFGADFMNYQASEFALKRPGSTLGNASNLGVWLCLVLPYVAYSAASDERVRWRATYAAVLVLGLAVLGLTLSRGAWLGALCGTVILGSWAIMHSDNRRTGAVATAGAGGVALLAVATQWNRVIYRFEQAFAEGGSFAWRASVWSDTVRLISERTVFGRGPASFRYVFGPYRSAETFYGRPLSQAIDDPHNVLLSTGVAGGLLGSLALLVSVVAALWTLVRGGMARGDMWLAASAASLLGGFVALQAHFLTLDTGAVFFAAIAIGGVAWVDDREAHVAGPREFAGTSPRLLMATRVVVVSLAVIFAFMSVLALGTSLSDRALSQAFALERSGAGWTQVQEPLDAAQRLTPLDATFVWAAGRVSFDRTSRGRDPEAFASGRVSYERAIQSVAIDPRILTEAGDFLLNEALAVREQRLFEEARGYYVRATELEPEGPAAWLGLGAAYAGLGDWDMAAKAGTRATELAPRNVSAWNNLAIYLEQAGDLTGAQEAKARAEEYSR